MTKIINSIEGARLKELDGFHSTLSDDYLVDKTNRQTKFIFEQFFDEGTFKGSERLALLNISYSIPSLISDKFSDYVGQPNMELDVDIEDFVSAFIWGGYGVFSSGIINDEYSVRYIAPDEYILESDGTQRVFTYINIYGDGITNILTQYILEQRYFGSILNNFLYKVDRLGVVRGSEVNGKLVPLTTLDATSGLPDEVDLGLDRSPITVVDNKKIRSRKYGDSEIIRFRSLVSSIEVAVVNIQDNFLKHLSALLALPASRLKKDPKTGLVDITELKAIAMEAGDTLPAYIMNTNPLISDSFIQIEGFLRQICAIVSIPEEFMGLKAIGGAESADAKRIRMTSFIKKVEKIRTKFAKGLENVEEIRRQWFGSSKEEFIVIWPAIFPEDPAQLVSQLSKAQIARLVSNKKAIMQYQSIDEDQAIAEQKEIKAEQEEILKEKEKESVINNNGKTNVG